MEKSLENNRENDGEMGRNVSDVSCDDGNAVGGNVMMIWQLATTWIFNGFGLQGKWLWIFARMATLGNDSPTGHDGDTVSRDAKADFVTKTIMRSIDSFSCFQDFMSLSECAKTIFRSLLATPTLGGNNTITTSLIDMRVAVVA